MLNEKVKLVFDHLFFYKYVAIEDPLRSVLIIRAWPGPIKPIVVPFCLSDLMGCDALEAPCLFCMIVDIISSVPSGYHNISYHNIRTKITLHCEGASLLPVRQLLEGAFQCFFFLFF